MSNGPTIGPMQANEVSENVNPINNVAKWPLPCDALFSFVNRPDGSVNSNAPSRLNPKTKNTRAINPFTQGLEPNCTTPKGPAMAVIRKPIVVNRTTMPLQNSRACTQPRFVLRPSTAALI